MKSDLEAPLGDLLDDPAERASLERIRRRVHATRRMPRAVRRAPYAAAAMVALAAGVAGYWALGGEPLPGPLRLADGAPLVAIQGPARTEFDDGSWVESSEDARIEPVENGPTRVLLVQGDGLAVYEVRPGGPRAWSIDAGALTVDVIGTRFVIERHGGRVRVEVTRGRVRVRGAEVENGLRTLERGDSIELGGGEPTAAVVAGPGVESASDGRPRADREAAETSGDTPAELEEPTARASTAPEWRRLASEGDYDEAFDAIGERGLREASARTESVDELYDLADTARMSGHPDLAVAPLTRLVAEHPGDRRAGLAALTLGRLQLDALNLPAEAVTSLERAWALGVPPRLQETALARLVEALRRAGDHERARQRAAEYLERFPDGSNAPTIRDGM